MPRSIWRDGREAEGAPLLRAYGVKLIEGSNPSLSANFKIQLLSSHIDAEVVIGLLNLVSALVPAADNAARRNPGQHLSRSQHKPLTQFPVFPS